MSVTKILIVDDFLPWHRFVRRVLESETDFKVIATAADGFEAVQKTTKLRPDVILMDINLPGMSGVDATREIRKVSPTSKVLFLSEHRATDLIKTTFRVGGVGYVLKSDCSSDLLMGIRSILGGERFLSRSLTPHWPDILD